MREQAELLGSRACLDREVTVEALLQLYTILRSLPILLARIRLGI